MTGRNEWKYIIDSRQEAVLSARLLALMKKDEHADSAGKYSVHSMYFDDVQYSCAIDTETGVSSRFKWRIRYYNQNTECIYLEMKQKINSTCYKNSCNISKKEYYDILLGNMDELLFSNKIILVEFAIDILTKGYKPSIVIDYNREAYVDLSTNTRITIDDSIQASEDFDNFLLGNYLCFPIQEKEKKVLEIKFDELLPAYIQRACELRSLNQTSFSKYYLGYRIIKEGKLL